MNIIVRAWKYISKQLDRVTCAHCRKSIARLDAYFEVTTTGRMCHLCKKCYAEIFTPFSRGK